MEGVGSFKQGGKGKISLERWLFEEHLEPAMQPVSQVEDVADAEAVRQECAWHVGTATG